MTRRNEADAKRAAAARRPTALGRLVLRVLSYRPGASDA
jgi:hypothetical protein